MFFLDIFLKIENHATGLSYMQGLLISEQTGNYTFMVMGPSVETNSPLITQEIPVILWKLSLFSRFKEPTIRMFPQLSNLFIIIKSSRTLLRSDFVTKSC